MTLTPITFVCEEPFTPPPPPERIYSGFNQYVRFLDELRSRTTQPIPVVHSLLRDALPLDGFSYQEWQGRDPAKQTAHGLYGLHQIGQLAGGECVSLFQSERYCYLQ